MALQYKLEYNTPRPPADESVYIHLKVDECESYQSRIGKETYCELPDEEKSELITAIFDIDGVVEVSSKANRIWIMKSPIFTWQEVVQPVLFVIRDHFGETQIEALPGSAEIDGSGFRLSSSGSRRAL